MKHELIAKDYALYVVRHFASMQTWSKEEIIGEILRKIGESKEDVVRCKDCIHAEILERNCELSKSCYMHCNLWRGDETRNVWHKYKKYYRDYSIVELDGYCSDGERRSGDE